MEVNSIIPLGSIVELKTIKDYVMIIGIDQISDGVKFDYCGCIHPYGFIGLDKMILFNSNQVEKVIFKGYFDEESKEHYEDIIWLRQNGEGK